MFAWPSITILLLTLSLTVGCTGELVVEPNPSPPLSYPQVTYPSVNTPTAERIQLGKLLFNDRRMSADTTVSCASCHKAEHAFADNTRVSTGVHGMAGRSNAPSIMYAAFEPRLLRGSTVPSLEMQVLVPIQESVEFNTNIVALAAHLGKDTTYQRLSSNAYGRALDAWVITRAISCFERSLPQFTSTFDTWNRGKQASVLTTAQLRGYQTFKKQCASCHSGVLFTNHNAIAIPSTVTLNDPSLMPGTTTLKVPSLRNVLRTAPYMHDGSITTIRGVLDGYMNHAHAHSRTDVRTSSISITKEMIEDIEQFLTSLSDR